ncbi:hypothetical protein ACQJBY_035432 [Aegilops geniculata]
MKNEILGDRLPIRLEAETRHGGLPLEEMQILQLHQRFYVGSCVCRWFKFTRIGTMDWRIVANNMDTPGAGAACCQVQGDCQEDWARCSDRGGAGRRRSRLFCLHDRYPKF